MSVFRDSLAFFDQVGLFDVVLPFLLVFTLVFGVLEKSRILGTEKIGEKTHSRKNLNAMVAFTTGFFVVASAQLVAIINVLVARVALILVILVMFMLLVASMHKQQGDDGFALTNSYKNALTGVVLAAIVLIFMDGAGWLGPLWTYVIGNWNSEIVGTAALFLIIVGFMVYVTKDRKPAAGKEAKTEDG